MGGERQRVEGEIGHLPPLHGLKKWNEIYQILISKVKLSL
jgi:hypothetical protein